MNEATEFRFAKDARTFSLISRGFQTSNEDAYHEIGLSAIHPEYLVNLPLLLELPGTAWVGLTEAHLDDYPNLFVTGTGGRALAARLSVRVEGVDTSAETAPSFDPKVDASKTSYVGAAPMRSSWRVFMIGDQPGRLVESNMVTNLNPPSEIADTSWIKPGKTPWDWWNGGQAKAVATPGKNDETMKYYIDFSARNKFEYMLIDAGWAARLPVAEGRRRGAADLTHSIPAIDIPMLVEYARSKGVRLWLWAHFRDMNDQMDAALAQFERWGVAGIKIDYLDRSDQWMVNWYRMAARKAAEHHLMLDFHGAFKPDGMRRTFPNVLTREGVMGAEYNKWSAEETPAHNVTLAFTRMLAGPMDYTPGGFDNVTREAFFPRNRAPMVMGTRAHQTALYVVFESELQMVSDSPDAYTGQKELDFLKAVPRELGRDPGPERRAAEVRHPSRGGAATSGSWAASPTGDARELSRAARLPRLGLLRGRDLRRRPERRRRAEGLDLPEAARERQDGPQAEARAGRGLRHPSGPDPLTPTGRPKTLREAVHWRLSSSAAGRRALCRSNRRFGSSARLNPGGRGRGRGRGRQAGAGGGEREEDPARRWPARSPAPSRGTPFGGSPGRARGCP